VIVSDQIFMSLQALLPTARGGDRPAGDDFVRLVLFPIRDHFAEHWDDGKGLLHNPEHSWVRTLITQGELVPMISVTRSELPDGTIELVDISIDFEGLVDPDDPE
jgi:hypothetical protein